MSKDFPSDNAIEYVLGSYLWATVTLDDVKKDQKACAPIIEHASLVETHHPERIERKRLGR